MDRVKVSLTLAVLLTGLLVGCSGGDPYAKVPISGKITYDDGTLISAPRIVLTFVSQEPPIDATTYPRNGVAEVNVADGTFGVVTTLAYGDGIVAGRHKVVVQTFSGTSNGIPEIYGAAETTTLEIDSGAGPLHIKIATN